MPSTLGECHLPLCDDNINGKSTLRFFHQPPSTQQLFQGQSCIFQLENAKHSAHITKDTAEKEEGMVAGPACSADLYSMEDVWSIVKLKNNDKNGAKS